MVDGTVDPREFFKAIMPRAQQLGRYLLLDRLAFGGMAEIYRAKTFERDGRSHLVAVKRVLPHLTTDEDFLRMLVDEAKLTARMKHQNIAQVYEFSQTGEEYFIAMEFVDGKDVRSLLERHRKDKKHIPPEHVAWIGAEVAAGLHAAHAQADENGDALHIVHRDISPSNMLCAYSGEVKVCDFGIAKATSSRVQTRTGVIKGKVKYMSPEQAMGRKLDGRSDLFSLGSVMYEMATLHPPFTAKNEVDLIFAVRDAKKRPMRELVPTIPDELAKIIDKLMMRSRGDRYQNGAEARDALWKFLDHYKPGYRKTAFGRYMRQVFATEIDKELRQLEAFEIEIGDMQQDLGHNLIAEALGKDAVYSKFTPISKLQPASKSGSGVANVHELDTRIFDESGPAAASGRTPLHASRGGGHSKQVDPDDMSTDRVQFGSADDIHGIETHIVGDPATGKSVHELETHILELPEARRRPANHDPDNEETFIQPEGGSPKRRR